MLVTPGKVPSPVSWLNFLDPLKELQVFLEATYLKRWILEHCIWLQSPFSFAYILFLLSLGRLILLLAAHFK